MVRRRVRRELCLTPMTVACLQAGQGPAVEAVSRDLAGMTDEQQLAAVTADAPELAALLQQLHAGLTEVRTRVGPLLQQVSAGCMAHPQALMRC